jgi:hypothetical protein
MFAQKWDFISSWKNSPALKNKLPAPRSYFVADILFHNIALKICFGSVVAKTTMQHSTL